MALSKAFVQQQLSRGQQIDQMQKTLQGLQAQVSLLNEAEAKRQAEAEAEAKRQAEAEAKRQAEAEAEARQAEAKRQAEARAGLKCYQCGQPATHLYRNNAEPQRNDSFRINGFSGTCSAHIGYASTTTWNQL